MVDIVWWGIKVKKADGTFHYINDIPAYVADSVDGYLDYITEDLLDEEGETIHTKTTEYVTIDKKDADGVVSSGWVEETTLWERK